MRRSSAKPTTARWLPPLVIVVASGCSEKPSPVPSGPPQPASNALRLSSVAGRCHESPESCEEECLSGESGQACYERLLALVQRDVGPVMVPALLSESLVRHRELLTKAHASLTRECDADDGRSCAYLGSLIRNGGRTEDDYSRAAEMFRRACWKGFADACAGLASLLMDGKGAERDWDEAARLLAISCHAGYQPGCELSQFTKDTAQLVRDLESDADATRARAADLLAGSARAVPHALPKLVELLSDAVPEVREQALKAVLKHGPGPEGQERIIAMAAGDPTLRTRSRALYALSKLDLEEGKIVELGRRAARETEPSLIEAGLAALRAVGPKARSALPEIMRSLKHRRPEVRESGVATLGSLKDAKMVRYLVSALRDPSAEVRAAAAESLGALGEVPASAIRALRKATKDEDILVETAAEEALEILEAG